MKLRTILTNVGVLAVSAAVAMLLCELGSRLILNPADVLSVEMVADPVFGAVPSNSTRAGGFDEWGFRNLAVPQTADIVTIGDSHTYGNTATMEDSWPSVLGRLTGRSVYNMGLGGYGPNQYFELFKTRALSLKPRMVVVGLYVGDDFENAFLITYGLERWAYLRELPAEKVNFNIWEEPPAATLQKRIRTWLSRHSVVYQLVVHGPLLGRVQGEVQIRNVLSLAPNQATLLDVPKEGILEAFLPRQILRRLDQDSESVREGMRITFSLLAEMNRRAIENHVQFVVAIIPTKEMVFSDYLEHNPTLALSDVLDSLIANERVARSKIVEFLTASGISYVDTLPVLKQYLNDRLYARLATDMHPGRNGYKAIAEAVNATLKSKESGN